jgi:hypothetical protein
MDWTQNGLHKLQGMHLTIYINHHEVAKTFNDCFSLTMQLEYMNANPNDNPKDVHDPTLF